MYLVAGLGNPGRQYEMTRHNIGFQTIDYIADRLGVKVKKFKFKSLCGECNIDGEKVLLVKPLTFMNRSGESIAEFVNFYKIPTENVIIISDDISLDVGRIRVRPRGRDGGHNGLKSIIYLLKSDEFARVRIGVGKPENPKHDLVDFVLGRFTKDEVPVLEESIKRADGAVCEIIKNGTDRAMSEYNGK